MAAPVPGGPCPTAVQGVGWGLALTAALSRAAWLQPGHRRVLAAEKGAGISTFGGYFQVLERSRGAEIVTKETGETGPSSEQRGAAGRGEGRAFCKPQCSPRATRPSAQHPPARLRGHKPKRARDSSGDPTLPSPAAGLGCSVPLWLTICERDPRTSGRPQTPAAMLEGTPSCRGAGLHAMGQQEQPPAWGRTEERWGGGRNPTCTGAWQSAGRAELPHGPKGAREMEADAGQESS